MSMRTEFVLPSGVIAALDNRVAMSGASPDDRGGPGSRGTVLLVPGYTGSKEDFQPLLRPMAAAGLRAVAIDQRGQYQSAWARIEAEYQLPALAGDLLALAEQLCPACAGLHLLGHSFGGLVARQAVLTRPELFADLVLMGSGPAAIEGNRRALLDSGEQVLAAGGTQQLWEHLERQARADPRYLPPVPAVQAFLYERFMATDPASLRAMGTALRGEADRTAELAALKLPILVLYGEDDDAWPPAIQSDMAARLGARVAVIEGAAHSPAVENPAATVPALLDFWHR
ncbi:MAG: alpha/beta fold hydrolase [Jatrophihabitantaceae bacterium]